MAELIAATPPATWIPALGRTPEEVLQAEDAGGWEESLWQGWARAAARERDQIWCRALLAVADWPGERQASDLLALLPVLPVPARATAVVRLLRRGPHLPLSLLETVPAPWPEPLARAVLDRLARPGPPVQEVPAVLALAGHRLPVGYAEPLLRAADRWPAGSPLLLRFVEAADLLTFRRDMGEELR